jgi:AAHS family 4-hydroxybenzoate transporter-like MFS transporter
MVGNGRHEHAMQRRDQSAFFIIGAQLSLNALITNYYPTAIQGTGVGWSQVVGRTGSLLGPLMGGALVSQGMSPSQLFQVSSSRRFLLVHPC